jgi:alpha-tubulin suppressor-like RCC1 family protein
MVNFFHSRFRGYNGENNAFGNLCSASQPNSNQLLPRYSLSSRNSTIKHIALGFGHTLILLVNGETFSCGDDTDGQNGRTGTKHIPMILFPSGIFSIAAGEHSSYLLTFSEKFYTFGKRSSSKNFSLMNLKMLLELMLLQTLFFQLY